MQVELVQTTTSDGLRLDGAWCAPAEGVGHAAIDALVWVHGTGSNFYGSGLGRHLAKCCQGLGIGVLLANTRGHDLISVSGGSNGPRRLGAALERVADAELDLPAWIELVRSRGSQRVGLAGHSLGAVKCALAATCSNARSLSCLGLVSPPRLSYASFVAGPRRDEFLNDLRRAEELCAADQPDSLIEIRFPLPYLVSAAGFIDKYGAEENYNIARLMGKVDCPTLATFGSVEVQSNAAFRGLPDELEALDPDRRWLRVEVVAGADHFYTGTLAELADRWTRWLGRLGRGR